ncbi:MAG: tetratricopeptide repeat protein [Gammaproteobacteria bacterium]|nr:MAG: tetratricopeptide repeat protein [Gammaproteobacteria bacterium]
MNGATVLTIISMAALWPPWPFGRDADRAEDNVQTIRALASQTVEVDTSATIVGSQEKAIESYQLFLSLASIDPELQTEGMRRLADLQLESTEIEQLTQNLQALGSDFDDAVHLYEQLLKSYPDYRKNDLVLYQLARAYEINGQTDETLSTLNRLVAEYPLTPHLEEAHFRRGETLFVQQRYGEAEKAYAQVLASGGAQFREQSLYKHGWSLFKQQRHEESLDSFFALLDDKFVSEATTPVADPAVIYAAMGRAEQELLADTLRVLSISFSFLGGPQSISDYFEAMGTRAYAYIVYSTVGKFYLEHERYQDTAAAYQAFIDLDPYHDKAPLMQAEAIDAYQQGGFANLVLIAKQDFVERYGAGSPYWQMHTYEQQSEVVAQLKINLGELAAHHHAEAQRLGDTTHYHTAAHWYQTYLESFPNDTDVANTRFLFAEVLYESGNYHNAALEYERTAYDYPLYGRGAEAGYAALLAYANYEETLADAEQLAWHRQGIESALRFAANFPGHEQAAPVLTDVAEKLFALNEFGWARDVGWQLLHREPPAESTLRRTAWTVVAHAEFDQENFAAAEAAYLQLLALTPADDATRPELTERFASSIYRQGEQAQIRAEYANAVGHFLRIAELAPGSEIAAIAQYDAAAGLIQLEDWSSAASVLVEFRRDYPQHELVSEVTAKLAVAYLTLGNNVGAANEFERIAAGDDEPQVRREALWQAGELYAEAGQDTVAAATFARYVERYPDPLAEAVEVQQKLVELAERAGDYPARMSWLAAIVAADRSAGDSRTERMRYLAAHAALELGAPSRDAFNAVRLVIPLQDSLTLKKERMEDALSAYGVAADYGVAEVTTAVTFEIANLYHSLSRDLFDSERPTDLTSLELAQYDILLEEQAYPFEEQAIDLHEMNAARTAQGIYDEWVKKSLGALAVLYPVRYAKHEEGEQFVSAIW